MRWPALSSKTQEAPPGARGVARIGRRPEAVLRRLGRGDIAVFDQVDLDRTTAHALVDVGVAGVVNVSPSISGRYPNLGPEILTAAGIALVDDVGDDVLRRLKDGATVRLHDGGVYVGDREVARGFEQTAETVADLLAEARSGLAAQLEAFSANTIEFMARERSMLLDGLGVPGLETALHERHVLVVAPGGGPGGASATTGNLGGASAATGDLVAEVRRLKHFIREYRPVLIGVGAGADALRATGHTPAVVVGTALEIDPELARRAVDVVVPADPDGHIAGLARLQDAGIDPVGFVSGANPEDMALLLAHAHGASLVVVVGADATLPGFLDRGRSGSIPSTFLARLRLGPTLVDSTAVLTLYRSRVSSGAVALLLVVMVVAVLAAALATGAGEALLLLLQHGTARIAAMLGGSAGAPG